MKPIGPQPRPLYPLVIFHYLLAAFCLAVLAAMLFFSSDKLTGHYFQPHLLAITHTAALGWGTLIIFGACYQLLPVILESELYSYKIGWASLVLFICGLVTLVYSFWKFEPGFHMQCGSLLLLVGIILFGLNVFLTTKSNHGNIHEEFIITACIWLVATAMMGTLLVFNFRYAFLPKDHILFLKLHAHMGLGGWFLMLIVGVSSRLVPMFLVSTNQRQGLLSWSYYLLNTGLILFLLDTYMFGLNIKTYFILSVLIAGISFWLVYIFQCFYSRMRKTIDLPIQHTFVSFFLLVIALFVSPFIIFHQIRSNPQAISYTTLYGTILFMGWITSLILGQTFKTLPFIVWIKHYHHLAGKGPTPMPADLFSKQMLKIQFVFFLIFICTVSIGLLIKASLIVSAGVVCFLIVAFVYLGNVLIIILHKPHSIEK